MPREMNRLTLEHKEYLIMNIALGRPTLRFCSRILIAALLFGSTAPSFAESDSPVDKINAEAARAPSAGLRLSRAAPLDWWPEVSAAPTVDTGANGSPLTRENAPD
jgi:hypothetical protein